MLQLLGLSSTLLQHILTIEVALVWEMWLGQWPAKLRMTDIVVSKVRSRMMAGIRSKGPRTETLVRSSIHRRGLRFATISPGLPCRPDVALPRWRVAVFVNGRCWHMNECKLFRMPGIKTGGVWEKKLSDSRNRDQKNTKDLLVVGWKVLTIWKCSVKGTDAMRQPERNMDRVAAWIRSDTKKTTACFPALV